MHCPRQHHQRVLEQFVGRRAIRAGTDAKRHQRAQKLTLLNSSLMQKKIEASRMIEFQTPPTARRWKW